ncbi:MAG: DNA mismatch repair protein MutS [Flavobacteriales bacterium]|nr:DNA mismatch repair protein MutS [Flavobacteriales bacterium]MCC6577443.1 DNA mismatch repair protein MutS [Flavobacteriales bacterium]
MGKAGRGETPLMQQYQRIKGRFPDAVLLFRVGDFYETFGEDAVRAAQVLGITLTRRNNGAAGEVPLAGFPHHALETYLPRLVRAGHRVAVCDQLEDPKQAKTVVERGVTEVVTPGVAFSDRVVDHRSNNWLAAVCTHRGRYGAAFLDITTGEFLVGEEGAEGVRKFMEGHAPSELLYPRGCDDALVAELAGRQYSYALEDWAFTDDLARDLLLRQFGTSSLKGFGVEDLPLGQRAAGAVLHYLGDTRHERLAHLTAIARLRPEAHVGLDRFTLRNLEVLAPVHEGGRTLCAALDRCATPMGSRLLKRWLTFPLVDRQAIADRHAVVEQGVNDAALLERCAVHLQAIGDLERTAGRAAAGRITPRELNQLRQALEAGLLLRRDLVQAGGAMAALAEGIDPDDTLAERLARTLEAEAPATLQKGGVIRPGIDAELDALRHDNGRAKDLLLEAQTRESERTGIPSLKVGFNSVFGYYLEVRNTHKAKVPAEWVRKQTLVGAERYITDELKALEERILGAEERILELETRRFGELVEAVCAQVQQVQTTAAAVAAFDVLRGLALTAVRWGYVRPVLDDSGTIDLRDARHPVIEQQLPAGEAYVANDLLLDPAGRQLLVVTGPNMSGKSALLRQTALIALMAQAGSFVPASAARLGVVDRIFTRVGASDDLSTGESTFMVEMNETASILNNLTARSLVVLDEIGRGTSTYDGISIAWAIAEHLHEHPGRPRTLFATHYHELNEMAASYPRIHNASIAVREVDGRVLFLRKLVPGGSDRSFGIHVARMAGMPPGVVRRAEKVLAHLERSHAGDLGEREETLPTAQGRRTVEGLDREVQLSFFQLDDPALEGIRAQLEALDIDTLTPVEALLKLNEIKRLAGARSPKLHKA